MVVIVHKIIMPSIHYLRRLLAKLAFVYLLGNIVLSEGLTQDQYVGCFHDNSSQFPQWGDTLSKSSMTVELCIDHCRSSGLKTYAKLQNGTVCQCGDNYGAQVSDSTCNVTCSGNELQYCGGVTKAFMTTYVLYAVCPVGNFGANCNGVCHCKRLIPCRRDNGHCPDGCDGNYTGSTCNSIPLSQRYIGCYADVQGNRTMTWNGYIDPIESCTDSCTQKNYSYTGLEFGSECWCGERYDKHEKLDESKCDKPCSGDYRQICGSANVLSAYSACPVAGYGKDCIGKCNCLNNGRCVYRNGSCSSSPCEPGWIGTACNLRDCATSNGDCNKNETCTTVDLLFANTTACRCSEGYARGHQWETCTDTNECDTTPSVCGEGAINCTNTVGSYRCHCKNNQTTYQEPCPPDVDECSRTPSICGAEAVNCSNTYGSYICYCKNGYTIRNGTCSVMASKEHAASGRNDATIIGAVVGSVGGLLVILAIIVVVVCCRRRKSEEDPSSKLTVTDSSALNDPPISAGDVSENDVYSVPLKRVPKKITIEELAEIMRDTDGASNRYHQEFTSVAVDSKAPCVAGKRKEVKKKNRFKNIIPYDHCRVILAADKSPCSDYINASFIKGYYDSDKLIATQGPRVETIEDFWRMIWEYKVATIVMVAQLVENQKVKCEKYWPEHGQSLVYGSFQVASKKEDIYSEFMTRHFEVSKGSETIKVKQWQLLSWEDCKTPKDVKGFLTFRRRIRQSMSPEQYTVVHCSAGAGRTGTFIAVDYLIEEGKSEGTVCILGCLQKLREQRSQMVQTQKQYDFIYDALLTEFALGDTTIQGEDFGSAYKALSEKKPDSKKSGLEVQFKMLEETRQRISEYEPQLRLTSKSLRINRITKIDATLVQSWRKPGYYISVKQPFLDTIPDFWTICIENGCRTVVFIDDKRKKDMSFVPTQEKPVSISSTTLLLQSASEAEYGMIYKISQQVEGTYENRAIYENWKGVGEQFEITVLHMTEFLKSHSIELDGLLAVYNVLRTHSTTGPVLILSSSDYELTGFCLAAFNGFDMLTEVKEIDVYQIVQDIRKSKSSFIASMSAYDELHNIFSRFIDVAVQSEAQADE